MKKNKIIKIISLIVLLVLFTGCTKNVVNNTSNVLKNNNKKEEKINYVEEMYIMLLNIWICQL